MTSRVFSSDCCNCDVIHEAVVQDVQSRMAPQEEYARLATLLKIFGDSTRVRILHALELHEMCVCDLAALLGVTKSAVSHQLKTPLASLKLFCELDAGPHLAEEMEQMRGLNKNRRFENF